MRTPEEIRLEIIGLYLERKKWGVAKYQEKANSVLESYAKEHAIDFATHCFIPFTTDDPEIIKIDSTKKYTEFIKQKEDE